MAQENTQNPNKDSTSSLIVSVALAFFIIISLSLVLKSIENHCQKSSPSSTITQQKIEPLPENKTPAQSQYKYYRPKEFLA